MQVQRKNLHLKERLRYTLHCLSERMSLGGWNEGIHLEYGGEGNLVRVPIARGQDHLISE